VGRIRDGESRLVVGARSRWGACWVRIPCAHYSPNGGGFIDKGLDMGEMCDKCGRGFGSARSVLVNGWELCASCARNELVLVNGWVDVNRAGSVSVPCPIGDLVGEPCTVGYL